jgi:multidrug transporter EmrE-like cation transporter
MPIVYVFVPGILISLILAITCFLKHKLLPNKILPMYLLLLGIQFLHFTEEYLADFVTEIPRLLDQEPYSLDIWISFNMGAYFIFILGAIVLYKQFTELYIIPIFFVLAGVLMNAVVHIATAIYVGGYFPGLYTAFIYAILGPVFVRTVMKEIRSVS